ncbi:sigma 54-interacting transcriptional regulator [Treponema socranskii]|uniref:sigma 54-interacting transcriptional regulator n=1 Tax=Treponema TaxID=157 RepID=UPI00287255A5|nr:sigma 54-interacting transcriptional regulator [Treponema socranskii]MDR9860324.1 sigma 54-interacting transcriptional regulator [Treponema socranskii]
MEVFPNLNTVVLISSDIKVIDWCRHGLEPAFSVKVIDSVQSYSYALAAFQNLVLVDTSLFNGQTEKIFTDIARRGRALFLVKFDDSFPLSYVQRHYKRCIPFPCDLDLLREVVERQAAASSDVDRIFKKAERGFVRDVDISGFEKFAGSSKIIIDVKRRLAEAAQREISVLLLGESGTGKTFAAKLLHDNSPRKGKTFVSVEMSSIAEGLAESELFGTVPGAYTGAVKRSGRLAKADGGTLFLDEIGDVPLFLQAKLLRILETGNYCSVGSDIERHVDVRLVCATNADLQRMMQTGKFRIDLYYRIAGYTITLPPLRQHLEDIDEIAVAFFAGRDIALSEAAREKLMSYDWPGNVRQLVNCLQRALLFAKGETIYPEDINF